MSTLTQHIVLYSTSTVEVVAQIPY